MDSDIPEAGREGRFAAGLRALAHAGVEAERAAAGARPGLRLHRRTGQETAPGSRRTAAAPRTARGRWRFGFQPPDTARRSQSRLRAPLPSRRAARTRRRAFRPCVSTTACPASTGIPAASARAASAPPGSGRTSTMAATSIFASARSSAARHALSLLVNTTARRPGATPVPIDVGGGRARKHDPPAGRCSRRPGAAPSPPAASTTRRGPGSATPARGGPRRPAEAEDDRCTVRGRRRSRGRRSRTRWSARSTVTSGSSASAAAQFATQGEGGLAPRAAGGLRAGSPRAPAGRRRESPARPRGRAASEAASPAGPPPTTSTSQKALRLSYRSGSGPSGARPVPGHSANRPLVPVPGGARPHEGLVVEPGREHPAEPLQAAREVEAKRGPAVHRVRFEPLHQLHHGPGGHGGSSSLRPRCGAP